MKFVIRDDDTCFFTQPEQLEAAYEFLPSGIISLSVVPFAVAYHMDTQPYGISISGEHPLHENAELVAYLREKIGCGRYDVLLHGHSHEYRQVDGVWQPELLWKQPQQVRREMREDKQYLENLLGQKISVYVPPHNIVGRAAVRGLDELELNLSSTSLAKYHRPGLRALITDWRRHAYRRKFGCSSSRLLDYGAHRERQILRLSDFEHFVADYQRYKRDGEPVLLYTHYWAVLNEPPTWDLLRRAVEYMLEDGAEPAGLSSCY